MKSIVITLCGGIFINSLSTGKLSLIKTSNWMPYKTLSKNVLGLYSMTDTIPLLMNKDKMMTSTIVHHVCVGLAHLYVINSDFRKEGIFKAIMVYGGFSSLAGLVNFYLGSRFLIKSKKKRRVIKKLALMSYVGSCACNWTWQVYYLSKLTRQLYMTFDWTRGMSLIFYTTMIKNWIVDDIILMRHLAK